MATIGKGGSSSMGVGYKTMFRKQHMPPLPAKTNKNQTVKSSSILTSFDFFSGVADSISL